MKPDKLIYPVIDMLFLHFIPVNRDTIAHVIVIPAEGPSFGIAP